jgi:hypothetical protein
MDVLETATESSAQDITSRVEALLFGDSKESQSAKVEEVPNDAEKLPEGDDSDSEDAEGSVESDKEAESLAQYLGVDEDNLFEDETGKIMVKAKIDGEQKLVPFKDVIASYQLQGHVNNKSIALENERKELEVVKQTTVQTLKTQLYEAATLNNILSQQLIGEYNSIDWDRMRVEQPAEWAAARQDFADRANHIESVKNGIAAKSKEISDENAKRFHEENQKHLRAEHEKLVLKNPTWSDPKVMKQEVGAIRTFLSETYEFGEEDLDSVQDSRLVALIQDAMAFRKGKEKVKQLKVKTIPKFQTPGRNKASSENLAKARDVKAKNEAIKKSNGSINSIANKILDRM